MIVVKSEFPPVETPTKKHLLPFKIDFLNFTVPKSCAAINFAQRIENVSRLDLSGQHLRHKPVKAIKIVPVDDRKTKLLLADQAGEVLVEEDDGGTAPERDYVRPLVRGGFPGFDNGPGKATRIPLPSPGHH